MHKKDQHPIDNLFRDKLKDHEIAPPAWELIEKKLPAQKRKKKMIFLWMKTAGAAALFTGLIYSGFLFLEKKNISPKEHNELHANNDSNIQNHSENKESFAHNKSVKITNTAHETEVKSTKDHSDTARNASGKKLKSKRVIPNTRSSFENDSQIFLPSRKAKRIAIKDKSIKLLQPFIAYNGADKLNEQDQLKVAQNIIALSHKNNNEDKWPKWSIRGEISPTYNNAKATYTNIMATNTSSSASNISNSIGGGITFHVKSGKKFSFRSGVLLASINQVSGNMMVSNRTRTNSFQALENVSNVVVNSSAGPVDIKNPPITVLDASITTEGATFKSIQTTTQNTSLKQSFSFLEVPLFSAYKLIDKRFSIDLIGGFSTNFLIKNNAYFSQFGTTKSIGETSDLKNVTFSSTAGLGLNYKLAPRLALNLEPKLKYFLSSMSHNVEVNYQPYSFIVSTGISFNF